MTNTDSDGKILKIRDYSNLNSSILNQVPSISMKQICLSLSDVAASLRRALLVDALGRKLLG